RALGEFDPDTFWSQHGSIENLRESHRRVLAAHAALDAQDFPSMASLDASLAAIESDDVAFVEAQLARVQWRIVDPTSSKRKQRGREALELLNQVLPYTRLNRILLLRLEASVLAGRPEIAIETARLIADDARTSLKAGPTLLQQPTLRRYLLRCQQVLNGLGGKPRIDNWRLQSVQQRILATLAELDD
ncbi:MAG: hypothetical protein AAFU85_21530, partial [Planctomycetota bacterium]